MTVCIKNQKLVAHFEAEQEIKAKRTGEITDPVLGAWSKEHPETMLYGFFRFFPGNLPNE